MVLVAREFCEQRPPGSLTAMRLKATAISMRTAGSLSAAPSRKRERACSVVVEPAVCGSTGLEGEGTIAPVARSGSCAQLCRMP